MLVNRFNSVGAYEAPNHFNMHGLRLQGFQEGGPENFWVGCSHFLPGGGAGPDTSPLEKVYVVLSGSITVEADGDTVTLEEMDSVCIKGNVERKIINPTNSVCTMLVIMPYPEA